MRYLLIVALCVVGCEKAKPDAATSSPAKPSISDEFGAGGIEVQPQFKKTYTRAEFEKLVVGKTQEEVLKAVGKPYKTSNDSWTYKETTKDPVADKVDSLIMILWEKGKAQKVVY